MKSVFKGRPIEITSVNCNCDAVDAFIEEAHFTDEGGRDLTDAELEQATTECHETVYEMWQEYLIGRADFDMDRMRDLADESDGYN